MSLTEREISRRKLLVEGLKRTRDIIILSVTGTLVDCFPAEKRSDTDDEIIDEGNMDQKLLEAFSRAINYPSLAVEIPIVENSTDLKNLPRYAQEEEALAKFGIESISFAQDPKTNDGTFIIVNFLPNIKEGKPFTKSPTPYPAFMLYGNGSIYQHEPTSGYLFIGENNNPKSNLKSLLVWFSVKKEQLSGKEFIIVFNHHLLNVNGQDLPSFTLPARFQVERAERFAKTD